MSYTVIVEFTDLKDNNRKYRVGDIFPREGLKVSKERLESLSTDKNKRGFPVIECTEPEKEEPVEIVKPEEKPVETIEPEKPAEVEAEVTSEVEDPLPVKKTGGRKKKDAK